MELATKLLHGDDHLRQTADVAPIISVSSTFNYAFGNRPLVTEAELLESTKQLSLEKENNDNDLAQHPSYVYSRLHRPTVTRAEAVLSDIMDGKRKKIKIKIKLVFDV